MLIAPFIRSFCLLLRKNFTARGVLCGFWCRHKKTTPAPTAAQQGCLKNKKCVLLPHPCFIITPSAIIIYSLLINNYHQTIWLLSN
jgi:hypothetical protein